VHQQTGSGHHRISQPLQIQGPFLYSHSCQLYDQKHYQDREHKKTGDTFVDFVINDPVREHDSLTLEAFVTLEWVNHPQNSVNVPFGDTMTTNFSSGCDIMEIRWKSKHIS
jgi:hypothetical protein